MLNKRKDYTKSFIACVYGLFWICILLIGGMMILFGDQVPMQLLVTICSWTPTIVLLIMFKKLLPNTNRVDFFKNLFKPKINWGLLLTITIIQMVLALASMSIVAFQRKVPLLSMVNLSIPMLAYAFFISLITGATGEESAWRGYLFPIMAQKLGVIKGSILLGFIWGFWHAPLWFATSGFTGLDLLTYIITFIIFIVSVSVIIGICYDYNKNIVLPMWIHLMVNFSASFYAENIENVLDITIYLTIFYVLTTLGFCWWHKKVGKDSISIEVQKE